MTLQSHLRGTGPAKLQNWLLNRPNQHSAASSAIALVCYAGYQRRGVAGRDRWAA